MITPNSKFKIIKSRRNWVLIFRKNGGVRITSGLNQGQATALRHLSDREIAEVYGINL